MSAEDDRTIFMRAIEDLDQIHQAEFKYLFDRMKGRVTEMPAQSKGKLNALISKATSEHHKEKKSQ